MKDNKLISMVDRVAIEVNDLIANNDPSVTQKTLIESTKKLQLLAKHCAFLQQPLTLGMFVPCVDGEPITGEEYSPNGEITVMFQQAKSKVLFEGLIDNEVSLNILTGLLGKLLVTVEDIQEYYNVTLTETALKQIR